LGFAIDACDTTLREEVGEVVCDADEVSAVSGYDFGCYLRHAFLRSLVAPYYAVYLRYLHPVMQVEEIIYPRMM
jgi:hypothetical protein